MARQSRIEEELVAFGTAKENSLAASLSCAVTLARANGGLRRGRRLLAQASREVYPDGGRSFVRTMRYRALFSLTFWIASFACDMGTSSTLALMLFA